MQSAGLYIHIPFCIKKCNYCDFYSVGSTDKMGEYEEAMKKQIIIESPLYKDYEFDTIFIGGGTPSLVSASGLESLVSTIKNNLNLKDGFEFTLEANPGTLTKEKLTAYKKAGVNRLSIGLQSTNDSELKMLGRIHNLSDFENSFLLARECGFENISVDIMYSLPNQKVSDLKNTLEKVISYNPEHISAYSLKIEENTHFGKIKDTLPLPNEDEEYEMYMTLCSVLSKNGYEQYEISNFAKKGYESRHNLKYWLSEQYLGIGPSAHSYIKNQRYYYAPCLNEYLAKIEKGTMPEKIKETQENDHVSPQISKIDEYIMLRLRLSSGVDEVEIRDKFGVDLLEKYPKILNFVSLGYMKKSGTKYSFTSKGFFVSNYILTEILSFE